MVTTSEPSDFHGFDVVRRGYDRVQVDGCLAALAAGDAPTDPPVFKIVRRGYDRDQVDAHVRGLLARRGDHA
ncbi:hypothetical protein OG535_35275 [Kitasatospora sp. NBC_00085]|uniref:hypothetical protein n=1 Tax=unclassified Kitasatospora TaxID=2633591 RepID=UPI00324B4DC3